MKPFKVAILGCGTVGGGVAKILLEECKRVAERAGRTIEIASIVDLFPSQSAQRHGIDPAYYCGGGKELTPREAARYIRDILSDESIDLVVETIGGTSPEIVALAHDALRHKKHLVTANKALLAEHGKAIFITAAEQKRALGYEAAVCAAIPIIKAINECFTGDEILSLSGIMNGTSNYILSQMEAEQRGYPDALKEAQERGYAEADPSLDVNGGDAGHKLTILLRIIFGLDIGSDDLQIQGIESITGDDFEFANEMDCSIKLICYAKREKESVFATVRPMMVKRGNLLSRINGATNAVQLRNKYAQQSTLIGQGAGSLETGSAIVSDIVFIARYGDKAIRNPALYAYQLKSFDELVFPYNVTFETANVPGITGIVTTAIGKYEINIDTVSHNRYHASNAVFSIVTMPCTHRQIANAVEEIKNRHPSSLLAEPKIIPILA
ncbi:MAG: homoserine dehydrogenase [Deltaproteobacteria bacterium]|nr:homoserine dehydrogenase [Deltaproteobacteria bacterium]